MRAFRLPSALRFLTLAFVLVILGAVATTAGPAPTARATTATLAPDTYTAHLLTLVNAERTAAGVAPLEVHADVTAVAVARALVMASADYFGHENAAGIGIARLLAEHGVAFAAAGENIGKSNHPADEVLQVIVAMMMASDGHRMNMLNARYRQIGIGIAIVDQTFYFSVVFTG